jgi:cytochrome c peroxidase
VSRKVRTWDGSFLLLLLALTGCRSVDNWFCNGAGCDWTEEEWARVQTLSPLEARPPEDRSNAYGDVPEAAELGQRFYFDTRFSGNATLVDTIGNTVPYAYGQAPLGQPINLSCASCHDPKRAGTDTSGATVTVGAGWYDVNGQQTLNAAYYPLLYWNGRTDSVWAQAAQVSESGVSMNGTRLNTFWVIVENYRADYERVFKYSTYQLPPAPTVAEFPRAGKPAVNGTFSIVPNEENRKLVTGVFINWAKAIAAYERTLISRESEFDKFVREGVGSTWLTPAARRGARLFVGKASCIDCHNGPMLSDGLFHDIGVPQVGAHVPTVADCPAGVVNSRCDCEVGNEKSTCLPSGAWAGLLRLARSSPEVPDGGINYNHLRRDSMWSDDPYDTTLQRYYQDPTDVSLKGAWRTPSLRDVAITAPYMHDGVFKTLEEVVWHYNAGGAASGSGQFEKTPARAVQIKPLGLRDDEMADLVEFLKALTGAPLPISQVTRPPPPDAGVPDGGPPDGASAAGDGGVPDASPQ